MRYLCKKQIIMKRWAIIVGMVILKAAILRGQFAHPNLLITQADVKTIKSALGKYPLFDKSFATLKNKQTMHLRKRWMCRCRKTLRGLIRTRGISETIRRCMQLVCYIRQQKRRGTPIMCGRCCYNMRR